MNTSKKYVILGLLLVLAAALVWGTSVSDFSTGVAISDIAGGTKTATVTAGPREPVEYIPQGGGEGYTEKPTPDYGTSGYYTTKDTGEYSTWE